MPCLQESLSARRAWIEISVSLTTSHVTVSLSARRAWIEIVFMPLNCFISVVALRKESVDRNLTGCWQDTPHYSVALRKESVDRNRS